MERIVLIERRFESALLIGCPDPAWRERLLACASRIDIRDPGSLFATAAGGDIIVEDGWLAEAGSFDLVVAIGTLDTCNDLPLALRLIRHALRADGLLIAAMAGGDTVPQLRSAMRAADAVARAAAPHAHPRIDAAALSPLLSEAGFVRPVVDVDRVPVSYTSFDRLVEDLRAMAATNVLSARPAALTRRQREAAAMAFARAGDGQRTTEIFEIIHCAAWTEGNA